MSADYRKLLRAPHHSELVPTLCHECVIDVTGFKGKEPRDGEVFVSLISSHDNPAEWRRWGSRIRRAWRALAGKEPWPWLEFYDRQGVEDFAAAVREASEAVYGEGMG